MKNNNDLKIEKIKDAIQSSFSKAGVLKYLGLKICGGNYKIINNFIAKHKVDTSHWTGQGHLKGRKNEWNKSKNTTEALLTENCTFQTFKLKQRLLKENFIQNKCFVCGITDWNGKPINMHLDHINGKNNDHRLENLRMLCPNCHSQTDTYCAKNKKIKLEIEEADITNIKNKKLSIKDASKKYGVSENTLRNKLKKII